MERNASGLRLLIAAAVMASGVVVGSSDAGGRAAGAATSPTIVSPSPGSRTASVTTQISLLGATARGIRAITVTGSRSGNHAGVLKPYVSEPGESFIPSTPFVAGEEVTVRVGAPIVGAPSGVFRFTVGSRVSVPTGSSVPARHTDDSGVAHYESAPTLDPPVVSVTKGAGSSGGDLLLTPKGSHGKVGPLIVDSSGETVWFDPLTNDQAFDLNEQTYKGQPVLTWFQGKVVAGHGVGEDVIVNRAYRTIATITDANGFQPDLHEFQLEPNGSAFVTSYQQLRWNMTSDGGVTDGAVWDGIVQELDIATGLVIYEWHSLDHVPVSLSEITASKVPGSAIDYFHVNSIQLLPSGSLLVSARNTSAIYEVSPASEGAVGWELGGKKSTFTMGPGTTFWFQHDARQLSPGTITVFDDEAAPEKAPESRAITIHLDDATHAATLARVVLPPAKLLGVALGNVQTLSNGDELIEWGTTPFVTEETPSGSIDFEAQLPTGDDTYRAYRIPWSAAPMTKPALAVTRAANGDLLGSVSWNGATAVESWRVLAGGPNGPLQSVRTIAKQTFEQRFTLPSGDHRVEVEALSTTGSFLATSVIANAP